MASSPVPFVSATPNPVPAGSEPGATEVAWNAGDPAGGRVAVSVDGRDEVLVAEGSSGSVPVNWIKTGSTYEFRLYSPGRSRPVASVAVRRDVPPVASLPATWMFGGLSAILLFVVARRMTRAKATAVPEYARTGRRAWIAEAAIPFGIAVLLFSKLIYSASAIGTIDTLAVSGTAFAVAAGVIAPLLLLPRFWRLALLLIVDAAASIALLADELYFRNYVGVLAPEDLASAPVLLDRYAGPVLRNALRWSDLSYTADVIGLLLALPFLIRALRRCGPIPMRPRLKAAAAALIAGAIATLPLLRLNADSRHAVTSLDRLRAPATIGPLPFQLYESSVRLVGTPDPLPDVAAVKAFLATRAGGNRRSDVFGAARGKNLILVQAESLQSFAVGLVIDGQPVTPNLDAFAKESLDFANFFDQTHKGRTSDGEFTTLASLHPLPAGAVSVLRRTNHYRSLPSLLVRAGYDTISASGGDATTWSDGMMHANHGFDLSVFGDRFSAPRQSGLLPDEALFSEMLPRIADRPRPFMGFFISSTNHGPPFEVPDNRELLRLPAALRGDVLGDYLQTVHYFDRAFGDFIHALRDCGALDDSVIVVYGDHQARLGRDARIALWLGLDGGDRHDRWLIDKRLPLLIRLPGGAHAARVEAPAGHLDIAPTLLSLLGVDGERAMFGRDATGPAAPFVVFRDGGFADAEHDYLLPQALSEEPACFERDSGRAIDCAELETLRASASDELAMSDAILGGDMIPRLIRVPLAKTFLDLADPRSFSDDLTADNVSVSGLDLSEPAPGGATFSVDNGGGAIEVRFSPAIEVADRASEPEGAIFELWSGGARVYQRHVLPPDVFAERISIPAPSNGESRLTEIAFVTRSVSGRPVRATWNRVRFLRN